MKGSSSVRGEVLTVPGGTTAFPPSLTLGVLEPVPVTQAYTGITGQYKMQTSHGDMVRITCQLFNASSALVANADAQLPAAAGWTMFNISLDHGQGSSTEPPARVAILITIDPGTSPPMPGAVMFVDDLASTGGMQSIDDLRGTTLPMDLFLNPVAGRATLTFGLQAARTVVMEVFDMQGRPVQRQHWGTPPGLGTLRRPRQRSLSHGPACG